MFAGLKLKYVKKIKDILLLKQEKPQRGPNHLNTQEIMRIPKTFHCKILRKKSNKFMEHSLRIVCQNNIINIK